MKALFENENNREIFIYGAHNIAKIALAFVKDTGIIDRFKGFTVTSMEGNPSEVEGYKVTEFDAIKMPEKYCYIIAVPSKFNKEISEYIRARGAKDIVEWDNDYADKIIRQRTSSIFGMCKKDKLYAINDPYDETYMEVIREEDDDVTSNRMKYKVLPYAIVPFIGGAEKVVENFDFVNDYKKTFGEYRHISSLPSSNDDDYRNSFDIYIVCSHMDKKADGADDNKFFKPIQAGAALTDIEKCEIRDNIGDNISARNKTMAEMTAIYWIWKNAPKSKYKGICHYRRQYVVSENEYRGILENDIDVVLNVPRFVLPSVMGQFERGVNLDDKDKDVMLGIIKDKYPEYYDTTIQHFSQPLFYSCNMMIAKQEIFDEYCKFSFDILMAFDDYFREKEGERDIKFTAYWAEIITSIFYVHNKNRFKIAVADFRLFTAKEE